MRVYVDKHLDTSAGFRTFSGYVEMTEAEMLHAAMLREYGSWKEHDGWWWVFIDQVMAHG